MNQKNSSENRPKPSQDSQEFFLLFIHSLFMYFYSYCISHFSFCLIFNLNFIVKYLSFYENFVLNIETVVIFVLSRMGERNEEYIKTLNATHDSF